MTVTRCKRRKHIARRIPSFTPCGYCFSRWATVWDHILPFSKGGSNSVSNLYPSCRRCNGFLYDKVFQSLEEKREHVRDTLIQRKKWDLPILWEGVSEEKAAPCILYALVQVEDVGPEAPQGNCRKCGGKFKIKVPWQKFCTNKCQVEMVLLESRGKTKKAGKVPKVSISPEDIEKARASQDSRDREYEAKYGHPYLKNGYYGHYFYDYNAKCCGIHISKVAPGGWAESEKHGQLHRDLSAALLVPTVQAALLHVQCSFRIVKCPVTPGKS